MFTQTVADGTVSARLAVAAAAAQWKTVSYRNHSGPLCTRKIPKISHTLLVSASLVRIANKTLDEFLHIIKQHVIQPESVLRFDHLTQCTNIASALINFFIRLLTNQV